MRLEGGARVSPETIYRFVWRDKRNGGDLHTHLRHSSKKCRKRYGKDDFRGRIPDRPDISERPDIVDARARFGDWEGDTVVGAGHRGGLVTLAERRSRLLLAAPIPRKTPQLGAGAQRTLQRPAPPALPQVHAPRRRHRRAGPAGRLQDQPPAAQVPRLQNPRRGLAKRLRFWRNHRIAVSSRCCTRRHPGMWRLWFCTHFAGRAIPSSPRQC